MLNSTTEFAILGTMYLQHFLKEKIRLSYFQLRIVSPRECTRDAGERSGFKNMRATTDGNRSRSLAGTTSDAGSSLNRQAVRDSYQPTLNNY